MAIVVLAIALAVVLDWKRARGETVERADAIAIACGASAVIAPLLPIASIVPAPVPAAGSTLPSFDAAWPCVAPSRAPVALAHVLVFVAVRALVPLGAVALVRPHVRAVRPPRAFAMVAAAAAALVLVAGTARVLRGGADLASFRTCGALTPEQGAPREEVDRAIGRLLSAPAPALVVTASAEAEPTRGGMPVLIGERTARVRARGSRVAILDDDAATAAVKFSQTPAVVAGLDARGRPAVLLLDERDAGVFALRVGRPASLEEIGPLARAPAWPLAVVGVAAIGLALSRRRRLPTVSHGDARPWLAAWILVECAASALTLLRPYA